VQVLVFGSGRGECAVISVQRWIMDATCCAGMQPVRRWCHAGGLPVESAGACIAAAADV